jgi:DoxX-like family
MQSESHAAPTSKTMVWVGRVISGLVGLAMLMSGIMKLVAPQESMEKQFKDLGWDPSSALGLGILEMSCALIYLFPKTAVLGAILLTGYLGGAIATHVRINEQCVLQVVLGVLVWGGLYLRDGRLRAILPLRR